MRDVLSRRKGETEKLTFSTDAIRKYFPFHPQTDAGDHHQAAGGMASASETTNCNHIRTNCRTHLRSGFCAQNQEVTMFISTFRYKPEYVACPLCTE